MFTIPLLQIFSLFFFAALVVQMERVLRALFFTLICCCGVVFLQFSFPRCSPFSRPPPETRMVGTSFSQVSSLPYQSPCGVEKKTSMVTHFLLVLGDWLRCVLSSLDCFVFFSLMPHRCDCGNVLGSVLFLRSFLFFPRPDQGFLHASLITPAADV